MSGITEKLEGILSHQKEVEKAISGAVGEINIEVNELPTLDVDAPVGVGHNSGVEELNDEILKKHEKALVENRKHIDHYMGIEKKLYKALKDDGFHIGSMRQVLKDRKKDEPGLIALEKERQASYHRALGSDPVLWQGKQAVLNLMETTNANKDERNESKPVNQNASAPTAKKPVTKVKKAGKK